MKYFGKKFFIFFFTILLFSQTSLSLFASRDEEKELTIKKMTIKIPEDEREQYTGDSIKELISIKLLNPEIIVTYSDKHTETVNALDCKFFPDTVEKGKNSVSVTYKDKKGNTASASFIITGIGKVKEKFQQNTSNGKWYMQASDGSFYTDTFKEVNGFMYLFDQNGYLLNGWQKYSNKFYYFDENNFSRKSGWFVQNGLTYYLDPNNNDAMAVGFTKIDNIWYYFKENGTFGNGWVFDKGKWYYIRENGTMQTGWLKQNNIWYYLQPENGAMATGWREIKDAWYYFASNGAMVVNTIIDGYYINSDGIWERE